jgi:hypothetical protein
MFHWGPDECKFLTIEETNKKKTKKNKSLLFLLNAACLAEKQQISIS